MLAVDVGAQWTKWARLEGGRVLEKGKFPTPQEPAELVRALAELGEREVGVAFAGFLREGRVAFSPNLPRYQGFPLLDALLGKFDRAAVENDANAFALGEALFGAGRGRRIVLGITLGTGIGGGLVVDGRLYKGAGFALEVGHVLVDPEGPRCGCGRRGCVEALLGERRLRERFGELNSQSWEFYGTWLGRAAADWVNLLDPEVMVFGGGLSKFWDEFKGPFFRELKAGVVAWEARRLEVRLAELGELAPLRAMEALLNENSGG